MAMNADECRKWWKRRVNPNVLLGVAQVFRFEESTRLLAGSHCRRCDRQARLRRARNSPISRTRPCANLALRPLRWPAVARSLMSACIASMLCATSCRTNRVRVTTVGRSDEQSGDVEAAAILTLEFRRGTLATVLVSTRAQYRTPLEFVGSRWSTCEPTTASPWTVQSRWSCGGIARLVSSEDRFEPSRLCPAGRRFCRRG